MYFKRLTNWLFQCPSEYTSSVNNVKVQWKSDAEKKSLQDKSKILLSGNDRIETGMLYGHSKANNSFQGVAKSVNEMAKPPE